jgi:DNA primase
LSEKALKAGWTAELLVKVGLSAPRDSDHSLYDRFRDRVIFPIRDVRGRTVGFGGRILPSSSSSATAPKHYNSSDTPLFSKSEQLYGLDQARSAGQAVGYLAVVEGYTDVLMAHQMGVQHVVATLGTALNVRHVQQLKRFVPRVILVFDADAGGDRGVDQALQLFVSQDVDLAIATLPDELDPCDLLVQQGAEAFLEVLGGAVDALEFKLARTLTPERMATVESRRQAVDAVLSVLAQAPELAGQAGAIKRQLVMSGIAQRVGIKEEPLWQRLQELRQQRKPRPVTPPSPPSQGGVRGGDPETNEPQQGPADPAERWLIELLLAEPTLVARVVPVLAPEELTHPGLRRVLQEMYALHAQGVVPDFDQVRLRLADHGRLAEAVLALQARGLANQQRDEWLNDLLAEFQRRKAAAQVTELRSRLPASGPVPVELLRQLQQQP